jgi:ABC-type xylose transport system substrate-binding protein
MKRLLVLFVVIALGVTVLLVRPTSGATNIASYDDASPVAWRVGLAFPSSGLDLFDRSTVGKWSKIIDDIKTELVLHGFSEDDIVVRQTDKRIDQVAQIDDLVQNQNVDELIVVPVELSRDELVAQSGDFATAYLRQKFAEIKTRSVNENNPKLLENTPYPYFDEEKPQDEDNIKYFNKIRAELNARTLDQALNDAKSKHIYTVGVSNSLENANLSGYPFDYFFGTPSPTDIANVQAGFAVARLGLPELAADGEHFADGSDLSQAPAQWTPRNVEALVADAMRPGSREFFEALWARIGPYFRTGYLQSASGLLNANTTADDFVGVAVTEDGDKAAGVMHNILDRYYKVNADGFGTAVPDTTTPTAPAAPAESSDSPTSDTVSTPKIGDPLTQTGKARSLDAEAEALGIAIENGTAPAGSTLPEPEGADELSFIFAQSDALSRGAVRACVESSWTPSQKRWPIITGSGAEKISVLDIVENKQAMSIGYDSKILANGIAQVMFDYATSKPLMTRSLFEQIFQTSDVLSISGFNPALDDALLQTDANLGGFVYLESYFADNDVLVNELIARPVTVQSDNLKEFLIDRGYISSQDAGL